MIRGSVLILAPLVGALVLAPISAQEPQDKAASQLERRDEKPREIVLAAIFPGAASSFPALVVRDGGNQITPRVSVAQTQLVMVLDGINCSVEEATRSADALVGFLKGHQQKIARPISIIVLSDRLVGGGHSAETKSLQGRELFAHRIPATTDAAVLARGLGEYTLGLHRILDAQGALGEAERVRLSLEAMSFLLKAEAAEEGAKVMIWVSPGWPFLNASASRGKSSSQMFDSVVYFSDILLKSQTLLYVIDPRGVTSQDHSAELESMTLASRSSSIIARGRAPTVPVETTDEYFGSFLKAVTKPDEANPNDLALQVLALQSGGLVLQHDNDLKSLIARCAADAERVVTLQYAAPTGAAGSYRSVEVSGGRVKARTIKGYYTR